MPTRRRERRRVRHEPERGVLYRVLREHLATFLSVTGDRLPRFVVRELQRYLACGILAFGFARVHCSRCGKEELVAFSCPFRLSAAASACPSCGARRMADLAAHLSDEVFPRVAVRQWVLSFPHRIRWRLLLPHRLLVCDRDTKFTAQFRRILRDYQANLAQAARGAGPATGARNGVKPVARGAPPQNVQPLRRPHPAVAGS
jgi:hypothetical protein